MQPVRQVHPQEERQVSTLSLFVFVFVFVFVLVFVHFNLCAPPAGFCRIHLVCAHHAHSTTWCVQGLASLLP